eukprot:1285754-Amphidinium_carterae.2
MAEVDTSVLLHPWLGLGERRLWNFETKMRPLEDDELIQASTPARVAGVVGCLWPGSEPAGSRAAGSPSGPLLCKQTSATPESKSKTRNSY